MFVPEHCEQLRAAILRRISLRNLMHFIYYIFFCSNRFVTRKYFCVFSGFLLAITFVQAAEASSVQFITVEKGVYSGISERALIVVRSEDDWNMLWARHVSMTSPKPDAPQIDFSKDMVIGVFTGLRPSGGYEAEIVKTERDEMAMTVFYREVRPSPEDIVSAVMTQPYHLIKTERQYVQIEFREIESGESHD